MPITIRFHFRRQSTEAWALLAILRNQSPRYHKLLTPNTEGMITATIEGDDAIQVNVVTAALPRSYTIWTVPVGIVFLYNEGKYTDDEIWNFTGAAFDQWCRDMGYVPESAIQQI